MVKNLKNPLWMILTNKQDTKCVLFISLIISVYFDLIQREIYLNL